MREPPLILIVDDNPANVEILQMRLLANNYDIITATDGQLGLDMAKEKHPDLILLDIMMPKLDGLEVCRRLKGDPSLPFMPIILVTAKSDSKDVVAGLEAGGDEYLTKPVDHAALVARVKSMLRIKLLHDTVLEQSSQLKIQLKTATKIQSLFWPEIPELEVGRHIWAVSVPATYVGGDLYDIIPLNDGSLLAYVADVSDKGVPAALIMAALSTKIRSEAQTQIEIDKLLESINNSLYNLISEEGFFATIVLVKYWPVSGKMQLALGGHLQPLWIVDDGIGNLSQMSGISLGVIPDALFEKHEIMLS
ncbi:MAG: response regulator, partial [Deltaproteobacteria bacterium]|nr:response regulator [Deltaproteobacteria bacterium]